MGNRIITNTGAFRQTHHNNTCWCEREITLKWPSSSLRL